MKIKPFILSLTIITVSVVASAQSPVAPNLKTHSKKSHSLANKTITNVYEINSVDVPPEFPGGNNAMANYINKERNYPETARKDHAHGRVLCGFVVNADGSVSHVTVMRKVHPELDREAVRIIENMPRWTAAVHKGENVPVFYLLPITFRL